MASCPNTPLRKIMAEHEDCIQERRDRKDRPIPLIDTSSSEEEDIDRGFEAVTSALDELDALIAAAKKRFEEVEKDRKREAELETESEYEADSEDNETYDVEDTYDEDD
uniref:Nucleotide exchange factor GrpE n=2 Tax=Caenorhabditis tropicalis TaxID=1561998 RepID=A0A1I7UGV1_9PELO